MTIMSSERQQKQPHHRAANPIRAFWNLSASKEHVMARAWGLQMLAVTVHVLTRLLVMLQVMGYEVQGRSQSATSASPES